MTKTSFRMAALAAMVAALTHTAAAQAPLGTEFTYQGQLKDGGNPANGDYDLRFRLFDALVDGRQVGAQLCANNVRVTDGMFTLALDFGAQFAGQERFVEIDVRADSGLDCANPAGFVKLVPRQPLTAAPNAQFALNADLLDGLDSADFLQSIPVPLTLSGTSEVHIIGGENTSTNPGSSGVRGVSTAANSSTYGGDFRTSSTSGRGVFGVAAAPSGPTIGGEFVSASTDGTGVFGLATSNIGATCGVIGRSHSTDGTGVFGTANVGQGTSYGGRFRTSSFLGFGAFVSNGARGAEFDVELSGPNGAINTRGFVYREYTPSMPSAAIPVAYGSISAAGAINGGTGNFAVSHAVTGEYDITIDGETYSNNTFAVSVTPLQNNIPMCGTAADVGVALRTNIWRLDTAEKADVAFQFVVYAASPSEPG